MRRYQRVSNSLPRHHSHAPTSASAIMKKPMATMMRKAKNTVTTGGRSLRRHVLQSGKHGR